MNIVWCILIYNAIVSGTVKSRTTGSPLETVHIQLQNTHYGCISAQNGNYILSNIPPGKYKIVFSMIGKLKEVEKKIDETATKKQVEIVKENIRKLSRRRLSG